MVSLTVVPRHPPSLPDTDSLPPPVTPRGVEKDVHYYAIVAQIQKAVWDDGKASAGLGKILAEASKRGVPLKAVTEIYKAERFRAASAKRDDLGVGGTVAKPERVQGAGPPRSPPSLPGQGKAPRTSSSAVQGGDVVREEARDEDAPRRPSSLAPPREVNESTSRGQIPLESQEVVTSWAREQEEGGSDTAPQTPYSPCSACSSVEGEGRSMFCGALGEESPQHAMLSMLGHTASSSESLAEVERDKTSSECAKPCDREQASQEARKEGQAMEREEGRHSVSPQTSSLPFSPKEGANDGVHCGAPDKGGLKNAKTSDSGNSTERQTDQATAPVDKKHASEAPHEEPAQQDVEDDMARVGATIGAAPVDKKHASEAPHEEPAKQEVEDDMAKVGATIAAALSEATTSKAAEIAPKVAMAETSKTGATECPAIPSPHQAEETASVSSCAASVQREPAKNTKLTKNTKSKQAQGGSSWFSGFSEFFGGFGVDGDGSDLKSPVATAAAVAEPPCAPVSSDGESGVGGINSEGTHNPQQSSSNDQSASSTSDNGDQDAGITTDNIGASDNLPFAKRAKAVKNGDLASATSLVEEVEKETTISSVKSPSSAAIVESAPEKELAADKGTVLILDSLSSIGGFSKSISIGADANIQDTTNQVENLDSRDNNIPAPFEDETVADACSPRRGGGTPEERAAARIDEVRQIRRQRQKKDRRKTAWVTDKGTKPLRNRKSILTGADTIFQDMPNQPSPRDTAECVTPKSRNSRRPWGSPAAGKPQLSSASGNKDPIPTIQEDCMAHTQWDCQGELDNPGLNESQLAQLKHLVETAEEQRNNNMLPEACIDNTNELGPIQSEDVVSSSGRQSSSGGETKTMMGGHEDVDAFFSKFSILDTGEVLDESPGDSSRATDEGALEPCNKVSGKHNESERPESPYASATTLSVKPSCSIDSESSEARPAELASQRGQYAGTKSKSERPEKERNSNLPKHVGLWKSPWLARQDETAAAGPPTGAKLSRRDSYLQAHNGYSNVDFYSLYDATMVQATDEDIDQAPWEYRDVGQRFLHEKSLESRNWFGKKSQDTV